MSFSFFILAILLSLCLIFLLFYFCSNFGDQSFSLKNIFVFGKKYVQYMNEWKWKKFQRKDLSFLSFYLLLHLLFPTWGFAFFLHSDVNFLVVIFSILLSLQLYYRMNTKDT